MRDTTPPIRQGSVRSDSAGPKFGIWLQTASKRVLALLNRVMPRPTDFLLLDGTLVVRFGQGFVGSGSAGSPLPGIITQSLSAQDGLELYLSLRSWALWLLRPSQRVHPCFTSLVVSSPVGRFGNQIRQISLALAFARLIPSPEVVLSKHFDVPAPDDFADSVGTLLRHESGSRFWAGLRASLLHRRVVIRSLFFYHQKLEDSEPDLMLEFARVQKALGATTFLPRSQALSNTTLVIHIRGGDVFSSPKPHLKYGQPPAAFYEAAIQIEKPEKVIVVSEDDGNPCVNWLFGFLGERGLPFDFHLGRSLEDDLDLLLRAPALCASRGTFCEAIAGLSQHLTRLYFFGSDSPHFGGLSITQVADKSGDYWAAVCADNWAATPEQLSLMLTYSIKNLSETAENTS